MTRINTNVSSLVAQNTLARNNNDLQTSLTRLSTGLRINTGKDDPAGLIASENLRRDITSIEKAITNTERANQLIATADSAIGQVSNLLNDIRGLVVEAANTGALSDEQIAANQLQVDSSLEAIDRIAQVTTFQGRKLLDGSLDFITEELSGFSTVSSLQIDQAALGAAGSVQVDVEITAAATRAQVNNSGGVDFTAGDASEGTITFGDVTTPGQASSGTLTFNDTVTEVKAFDSYTFDSGATLDIGIKAGHADADIDGTNGNGVTVNIISGDTGSNAHASAAYDSVNNELTITVDNTDNSGSASTDNTTSVSIANIITALNADSNFTDNFEFDSAGSGNFTHATDNGDVSASNLSGGVDASSLDDIITITSDATGAAFDGTLTFATSNGVAAGAVDFSVTGSNITVTVNDNHVYDISTLAGLIDTAADADGYSAALTTNDADTSYNSATDTVTEADLTGGVTEVISNDVITLTADEAGAAFDGTLTFATSNAVTAGEVDVQISGSDVTVTVNDNHTYDLATLAGLITDAADGYTATLSTNDADGSYDSSADTATEADLTGGTDDSGTGLAAELVVEISGSIGSQAFTFDAGTTLTQIINAVNLVSDATGVQASNNAGDLQLDSTTYGSDSVVDVRVISEGTGGTFEAGLDTARDVGTDIVANVNGVAAKGDGNTLSINTATLDLTLTVDEGTANDVSFNINGGGALFQLGPNVVGNQQARLGINSLNTARLGGVSGSLFQLASGGVADLSTDTNKAAKIVDEVISEVTGLRGRLGAFQKTTLDSNLVTLGETVNSLTEAESSIRDADFAAESAKLTRAQILVQSGTSVLAIANQNPQNVLALLR